MRSYTDLEQSKKLAEILPPKSADAFYDMAEPDKRRVPIIGNPDEYYDMEDWTIPCWSLAALLEAIRAKAGCDLSIWDKGYNIDVYDLESGKAIAELYSNPVDAAVETIYKLRENNLL